MIDTMASKLLPRRLRYSGFSTPYSSVITFFFLISLYQYPFEWFLLSPDSCSEMSTTPTICGAHNSHSNHFIFASANVHSSRNRKNPYTVLGVSPTASLKEIQSAFRKLSLQYHPDRDSSKASTDKYNEITEAHHILGTPKLREIFDEQGFAGVDRYETSGMEEPRNPFASFFDMDNRFYGPDKAPATELKIRVSLEDLFYGTLMHVQYTRPVLCSRLDSCLKNAPDCVGNGVRAVEQRLGPGFIIKNQVSDPSCISHGKAWKSDCKECPDGVRVPGTVEFPVSVDSGMKGGDKIEFEGQGEERIGMENGDLVLTVEELPHRRFFRKGDNLETVIYIDLKDALIGFTYELLHLNRQNITLQKDAVTFDGEVLKKENRGMPIHGESDQYGDLYVTVRLKYPKVLSTHQKRLIVEALQDVKEAGFIL